MFVTYAPEGEEPQRWAFDPRKVRASEAEAVERQAGESWDSWLVQLQKGGMRARRVLLWHMLRGQHPALRFEDTPDFYAGDLTVEYSLAELEAMRDRVVKAAMSEEQRQAVMSVLDTQIKDARERGADEGKAPSLTGGNATPSP